MKKRDTSLEYEVFDTLNKCYKENENLINTIEYTLLKGLDVNYQDPNTGTTFLMLTVEHNLPTLFDLFLRYRPLIEMRNDEGESVTHLAARNKNSLYLDQLIENKANLNVIDRNGNTPLNGAIKNCVMANIKTLMDHDVHLNFLNYCGLSIYDIAYMTGDIEVIKFVLNYEKKKEEPKKKKNIIKRILRK